MADEILRQAQTARRASPRTLGSRTPAAVPALTPTADAAPPVTPTVESAPAEATATRPGRALSQAEPVRQSGGGEPSRKRAWLTAVVAVRHLRRAGRPSYWAYQTVIERRSRLRGLTRPPSSSRTLTS